MAGATRGGANVHAMLREGRWWASLRCLPSGRSCLYCIQLNIHKALYLSIHHFMGLVVDQVDWTHTDHTSLFPDLPDLFSMTITASSQYLFWLIILLKPNVVLNNKKQKQGLVNFITKFKMLILFCFISGLIREAKLANWPDLLLSY